MPVTGVGNANDLDIDALYHSGLEDCEHSPVAALKWIEPDTEFFYDGVFVTTPDGSIDNPGATFILKVNWDRMTYQCILSPVTGLRGRCSLCYPGQADVDADGDIECYLVPDEYLRGE